MAGYSWPLIVIHPLIHPRRNLEKSFYEQTSNIQNINQLFPVGGAAALAVNAAVLCATFVRRVLVHLHMAELATH